MAQFVGPCHPQGRTGSNSGLLTATKPSPRCCGQHESTKRQPLFLSLLLKTFAKNHLDMDVSSDMSVCHEAL